MPTCGNCKTKDASVADIRACYQGRPHTAGRPVEDKTTWPASDAQIGYLLGLQAERELPESYVVLEEHQVKKMDRDKVSANITMLKAFPRKPAWAGSTQDTKQYTMPAGRYALHWEDGGWWFYQVDKPTEGRWKGYTFIKRLIGAPGDYRKHDMNRRDREDALKAIEEDPKAAMIDYGLQSSVCGMCSSPLTDPDSRKRGLGPICAGKTGWF